jgi:hypothetical protein
MEANASTIAELVEQMPATDRELETVKAMLQAEAGTPAEAKTQRGFAGMGGESKFTGPNPEAAAHICEQVLAGGRDSLIELIGAIRDPGDPGFVNYKAEYLLHCLVIYAGRPGKEAQRRLVIDTLASQLSYEGVTKAVRGFLVRELQLIGDASVTAQVGKLLEDETLCQTAVAALVVIGGGTSELLRAALAQAKGRNRLCLVQNLGVLRDESSVSLLRQCSGDEDREVRLAAAWALANLADAGSIDLLIKMADTEAGYERIKATQACVLLAEKLASGGKAREAARIYTHLRDTRKDKPERYLRNLAEQALARIT